MSVIYINDPNFFGVNGFSGEKFQKSKISKYSKYVYGLGKGFSINNIGINIITQKPKIQKYKKKIIFKDFIQLCYQAKLDKYF